MSILYDLKILSVNDLILLRNIFFENNTLKLGDMALKELIDYKIKKKLFNAYGSCYLYMSPEMFNQEYDEKTDIWYGCDTIKIMLSQIENFFKNTNIKKGR